LFVPFNAGWSKTTSFERTGILVLLSAYTIGGIAPIVAGTLTLAITGGLWFALPLARRTREQ
jgi:hypothetical protein